MNNLLSYYGLVDARTSASEKDLPLLDENGTILFGLGRFWLDTEKQMDLANEGVRPITK